MFQGLLKARYINYHLMKDRRPFYSRESQQTKSEKAHRENTEKAHRKKLKSLRKTQVVCHIAVHENEEVSLEAQVSGTDQGTALLLRRRKSEGLDLEASHWITLQQVTGPQAFSVSSAPILTL